MTRPSPGPFTILAAMLVAACGPTTSDRAPTGEAGGAEPPDAPAPGARTMPLKSIMAGLASDMSAVAMGLWTADPEAVAGAAGRVADHPTVPPEQLAAIQSELAERFAEFVRWDRAAHDLAVELREVAGALPATELAGTFAEITGACLGCHAAFRERLVPVLAATTPSS